MMLLLFFAVATIGLTNILVHGQILDLIKCRGLSLIKHPVSFRGRHVVNYYLTERVGEPRSLREWMQNSDWSKKLLECYECTGFWAGLVCGYIIISQSFLVVLACGFAGGMIAQTYTDSIYLLRSKIELEVGEDDAKD